MSLTRRTWFHTLAALIGAVLVPGRREAVRSLGVADLPQRDGLRFHPKAFALAMQAIEWDDRPAPVTMTSVFAGGRLVRRARYVSAEEIARLNTDQDVYVCSGGKGFLLRASVAPREAKSI